KDGGEPRLVTRAEADFYGWLSQSFSPDGKRLYFLAYGPEGTRSVNVAFTPVLEAGAQIPAPQFLTSSRRVLSHLVLSADGRKLIYRDLGRLWLQELSPEGELLGQPHSLTAGLAFYSSFSADGKRLCYLTPQGLVLHDLESGNTTPIPLELDYEIPENCSSLLVRNVRLIDGTGSPPREGVDILVRNGRIARIAPTGTIPAHRVEVLDAGGKTAIPGLIDMHIHTRPGNPVAAHLYFGTTSYRDVGSPSYVLLAQVEAIRAGREIGPRVFYAGELFESPQASYAEASRLEIANEAQAIAHFERLAGLGYHVTKADPRSDSIPGPLQQVIVEQSHALGRPVTGHWNVQSILRGMDGVEHNPRPWLGGRAYDDYLQLTARSGICLTPTLQTSASSLMAREHPEILDDPVIRRLIPAYHLDGFQARVAALTSEQVQTTRADFQRRLAHLRRIRELGGKIVAGTDTRLSGLSLHWELQHYVEAGMTPMEALLAATREAAACLGYPHELGSIEEGKIADIVLLAADPLEDISNTLRIAAVIHDGRVVDREKLLRPPQE
ncbi:MAG: amidohydrolase family protein, partial [Terriglobia bacterium]